MSQRHSLQAQGALQEIARRRDFDGNIKCKGVILSSVSQKGRKEESAIDVRVKLYALLATLPGKRCDNWSNG